MNNSFYKELSEMAEEAINELNKYEQTGNSANVFDYIRRVSVPCLNGSEVKQSILDDIPLREQIDFKRAVVAMTGLNTLSGSHSNEGIRSRIEYFKGLTKNLSQRDKGSGGTPKIFYSWQATLPGNGNRSFIRAALSKAINEINDELAIEGRPEATLDSDTANTPGSPDIIRTILAKVDAATIFVADITLVNETQQNPNVMFELGYAIKALGESNIILLFNEHYGSPKDLPFDLGLKRAMLYRCDPDTADKSAVRKDLASRLKGAITSILAAPAE